MEGSGRDPADPTLVASPTHIEVGRAPPPVASPPLGASPPLRGTVVLAAASPKPLGLDPGSSGSTSPAAPQLIGAAVLEWLSLGMAVFEVQCELGRGSFGRAVLARHTKDGQFYVVKQIDIKGMSEREKRAALREVQVLSRLRHPNIIGYYGSFIDADAGVLHIILEYADRGDLAQAVKAARAARKPFSEAVILSWFCQLVSALHYVHSLRILHRDLKCSNILLHTADRVVKVPAVLLRLGLLLPSPLCCHSPLPHPPPLAPRSPTLASRACSRLTTRSPAPSSARRIT